jgi:hypothetical protein
MANETTQATFGIIDNAGNYYIARDGGPGLEHAYVGIQAKRSGGGLIPKAKAKTILVRRFGTRVITA